MLNQRKLHALTFITITLCKLTIFLLHNFHHSFEVYRLRDFFFVGKNLAKKFWIDLCAIKAEIAFHSLFAKERELFAIVKEVLDYFLHVFFGCKITFLLD